MMQTDHKNSILLGVQYIVSLLLSLIGLKLNFLTFGVHSFDLWLLLLSIWGVGQSLDLGFGISVVKYVAELKDDFERINSIVSTGLATFIFLGLIVMAIGYAVGEIVYFPNSSLIPAAEVSAMRIVFWIMGLNFLFQYISIFLRSIFSGRNNFVTPVKLNLLFSSVLFSCIVVVYFLKLSMLWLASAYMFSSFIQCCAYQYLLSRQNPLIKMRFKYFSFKTLKKMFGFSLSVQITMFLGAMIDPIVKYMIGMYMPKGTVSIYEVARRITLSLAGMFNQSFTNYFPKISVLNSKEEYLKYLLSDGIKITRLGIIFSGVVFGVLSFFFVALFKYYYGFNEMIILFFILGLAESINITFFNLYIFVMGIGKGAFLIIQQLMNVIIIALFLFIGFTVFENSYAFVGYFLSVLLGNTILLLFVKRICDISVLNFLHNIRAVKLVGLLILMFTNSVLLIMYPESLIVIEVMFSIVCIILFANDLVLIISMGKELVKRRFLSA